MPGAPELIEAPFGKVATLVTIASHDGPLVRRAHVALPACTWAETEGTFVNSRGMAQKSERAIDPKGQSRPAWELVSRVGEALGYATHWRKLKDVRRAMEPETAAATAPLGA
jgi:NADH-quinone oxidoreductase subunit G